jgi:flagellar hook assembly protein FlgD
MRNTTLRSLLSLVLVTLALQSHLAGHVTQTDPQLKYSTRIDQITPNPYDPGRGAAEIRIYIARRSDEASIEVFASDGRTVGSLFAGPLEEGAHLVHWDGRSSDGAELPNGVYICKLQLGKIIRSANIVIAR